MILYLDTSAYVRLYVDEPGSDLAFAAVRAADSVIAHWIGYAEIRATLAKLRRTKRLTAPELMSIKESFESDWRRTVLILPTEAMVRRAGDLAERFGLRGYDSVHLAAAESLQLVRQRSRIRFASFDEPLNKAAAELGLSLL